jgi:hypothetical protein
VWAVVGVAVLAVGALLASGRLNASVLPKTTARPAPLAVQCFQADGTLVTSWSADTQDAASVPRVDPLAVCTALIQDQLATAQLDALVTQQRALGRDCVAFAADDGSSWVLSDLETPNGTYVASGGPAPGRLPDFGEVAQPAPLVSLAPTPTPAAGCVQLPTLSWKLAVPPLAACTADDLTISVYERHQGQSAEALCASKQLVVATE